MPSDKLSEDNLVLSDTVELCEGCGLLKRVVMDTTK
jgi:hypothetical protein